MTLFLMVKPAGIGPIPSPGVGWGRIRSEGQALGQAGAVCAGQRQEPRGGGVASGRKKPLTSIPPEHLVEMADGRRRSLTLRLPVQMVPDTVRQLAERNVADYHVQLHPLG
jgi:hypothetical protein